MIRNRKDIKQSSFKKKNILLIQTYLNLNNWFLIQNVMVLEHSNVQLLLGHHHKCMEHCRYTICHNEWHICDVVILCESRKKKVFKNFFIFKNYIQSCMSYIKEFLTFKKPCSLRILNFDLNFQLAQGISVFII